MPRNISEVDRHKCRDAIRAAMQKEIDSHTIPGRETWILVPESEAEGHNILGSTWAIDAKTDADHNLLKWKGRLYGQGFTQQEGSDYFRSYSHTISLDALRLFFSLSMHNKRKASKLIV